MTKGVSLAAYKAKKQQVLASAAAKKQETTNKESEANNATANKDATSTPLTPEAAMIARILETSFEDYFAPDQKLGETLRSITKYLYDLAKKHEISSNKMNGLDELPIEGLDNEQIWEAMQLRHDPLTDILIAKLEKVIADIEREEQETDSEGGDKESEDAIEQPYEEEEKVDEDDADRQRILKRAMAFDDGESDDEDDEDEDEAGEDVVDSSDADDEQINAIMKRYMNDDKVSNNNDDEDGKIGEGLAFGPEDEEDMEDDDDAAFNNIKQQQLDDDDDETAEKRRKAAALRGLDAVADEDYIDDMNAYLDELEQMETGDIDLDDDEEAGDYDEEEARKQFLGIGDDDNEDEGEEKGKKNSKEKKTKKKKLLAGADELVSDDEDGGWFNEKGELRETDAAPLSKKEEASLYQKQEERMLDRIQTLEEENLRQYNPKEKDWQLAGEVFAKSRPENSLLEEHLEFDRIAKLPPVITPETTKSLEDIIIHRIVEGIFDDPKKKEKSDLIPDIATKDSKQLNSEKSEKSLAEIYQDEFMKKLYGQPSAEEEKEQAITDIRRAKADKALTRLLYIFDSLSNFTFTPKPIKHDVTIRPKNLPSITMEEAIPVAASEASLKRPEEVLNKSFAMPVGDTEKADVDKKRSRRKAKIHQRDLYKKMERMYPMFNTLSRAEKNALIEGKKLKDIMKMKEGGSDKKPKLTNSTDFFAKMQEKQVGGDDSNNKKRKRSDAQAERKVAQVSSKALRT